jgi:hypothetical protein
LVAVTAAIGVSCATSPAPAQSTDPKPREARLAENVDVRAGQAVQITGQSPFIVTFERVTEDSRCPIGVNCIWAGNAVVRLAVDAGGGDRATVDVHTFTSDRRSVTHRGYRIRLVQLVPAPKEGASIAPDQYVATIVIDRSG